MKLFARITKVDQAKREVWGRAVEEVVDKVDEIFDYTKSKPYFEEWSKGFAEATDGKSLGNIRAMHGKVAAGKAISVLFNDPELAIDIGTKIVDDNEWKKCEEGVYTGFSIGGEYVGERVTEKIDGREVKRYVAKPSEISLVDNPCIPTAKFFDVIKADGSIAKVAFRPPEYEIKGSDEEVGQFAKLLNDSNFTIGDAISAVQRVAAKRAAIAAEVAKDETLIKSAVAKPLIESDTAEAFSSNVAAEIKAGKSREQAVAIAYAVKRKARREKKKAASGDLRKGMWSVTDFASVLSSIAGIARSEQWDAALEGDASPIPAALKAWLADGIEIFKTMASEEVDELLEDLGGESVVEAAARIGALRKRLADPDLSFEEFAKIAAKHLTTDELKPLKNDTAKIAAAIIEKAARSAKTDAAHLQEAHDHLTAMGAACSKEAATATGDLAKAHSNELASVRTDLAAARKDIDMLKAQPVPYVTLRTVKKGDESAARTTPDPDRPVDPNSLMLTKDDYIYFPGTQEVDYTLSRIMKADKLARQAQA